MSFLSAVKASQSDLVYLVSGPDKPTGKNAWWYVQVENKAKLPIFLKRVSDTGINLVDYGAVLYSGWGDEPPQETQNEIKKKFG